MGASMNGIVITTSTKQGSIRRSGPSPRIRRRPSRSSGHGTNARRSRCRWTTRAADGAGRHLLPCDFFAGIR